MITSGQVTVGTAAAVQVDGSSRNPSYLTIHNNDNTKTLYLGGSDVTTANGLVLLKEETISFTLNPGEALYAISANGNHVISWLRQAL
jgi:hypothetical protein